MILYLPCYLSQRLLVKIARREFDAKFLKTFHSPGQIGGTKDEELQLRVKRLLDNFFSFSTAALVTGG